MTRLKVDLAKLLLSVLLAASSLTMFTGQPVGADEVTRDDPKDTDGPLDVRVATHGHARGLLKHRVTMYEEWDTNALSRSGNTVRWFFSFDGKPRRAVDVLLAPDGSLYAEMWTRGSGRTIGFTKVWRPDAESLQIEFPKRMLKRGIERYRWSVTTRFHEPGHPECGEVEDTVLLCADVVPDHGSVRHRLR